MKIELGLTTTRLYLVPPAPESKCTTYFLCLVIKDSPSFQIHSLEWQLPSVHPPCEVEVACSLAVICNGQGMISVCVIFSSYVYISINSHK